LQLAWSAFRRLLIHMILITTAMVMGVQKQHSCGALADCRKSDSSMVSNLAKISIFKIAVLFIGLSSLMPCTHDLTVLTKIKEMTRYCESFGYSGRNTLINVSNDLTHVSVPIKEGSQ
jgi:Mn2+/Fe2+ NRAMP family transporter